jgi:hypothetical protein
MLQWPAMRTMRTRPGWALAAVVPTVLSAALWACGPSAGEVQADRAEIEKILDAYLPALAHAYVSGNVDGLRPYAAEKEVLSTEKRIRDLLKGGREVHPDFKQLTIEKVTPFQHSNAYVTTVETWDIKVFAAGTDRLLSEEPGQISRVTYQLKRDRSGWKILYRQLAEAKSGT